MKKSERAHYFSGIWRAQSLAVKGLNGEKGNAGYCLLLAELFCCVVLVSSVWTNVGMTILL